MNSDKATKIMEVISPYRGLIVRVCANYLQKLRFLSSQTLPQRFKDLWL